jgi:hypothetical protein
MAISAFSQTEKGIDTQTKTIQKESAINDRSNDVGRSISFGKGKTKVRKRLLNPYPVTARRDILVKTIISTLKDKKVIIDESASRFNEGLIVTKPLTFSKGAIITKTELNRYAKVPLTDQIWTRGRYTMTIEVQSIDGIRNNVFVTAKIEGRSENGIFSEWSTLPSSGVAEEELLTKLVENLGGDLSNEGRRP